jgi:hypothetical protein
LIKGLIICSSNAIGLSQGGAVGDETHPAKAGSKLRNTRHGGGFLYNRFAPAMRENFH